MSEQLVGIVEHYYPRVHAATVWVKRGRIRRGDRLHIHGKGIDLFERVHSLQLDHEAVHEARAGQHVGVQISYPVKERCDVFILDD